MDEHFEQLTTAPHNDMTERALLYALLSDAAKLAEIIEKVHTDDFFVVRHAWVYEAMCDLYQRGDAVDLITVIDELRRTGRLEDIGGPTFVTSLTLIDANSAHAYAYAEGIVALATRRRMLTASDDIAELAVNEHITLSEALNQADARIGSIIQQGNVQPMTSAKDVASEACDFIDDAFNGTIVAEVPWGVPVLDKAIGGFPRGGVTFLGARPKMGKSWSALLPAYNVAQMRVAVGESENVYRNRSVLYFSLEMPNRDTMLRAVALHTGLNSEWLRKGLPLENYRRTADMTAEDRRARDHSLTIEALDFIASLPIHFRDKPGIGLSEVENGIKRMIMQQGRPPDLVVVDYFQLMHTPGYSNVTQMHSDHAQGLHEIAMRYNIAMLVPAQLNRKLEDRADKRPVPSDFKETGRIEEAATKTIGLYRDFLYTGNLDMEHVLEFICMSNRHGPTGAVSIFADFERAKFAPLKKIELPQI